MARFRLSRLAEADLAYILATSEERWGTEARRRYAALLAAAMRKAAGDPRAHDAGS
jgi:toxin ParE1/3/4